MTHPTASELHAALHYFGQPAPEPGGFMQAMTTAVVKADTENQARISQAFPALVTAVRLIQTNPDGVALVQTALEEMQDMDPRVSTTSACTIAFLRARRAQRDATGE